MVATIVAPVVYIINKPDARTIPYSSTCPWYIQSRRIASGQTFRSRPLWTFLALSISWTDKEIEDYEYHRDSFVLCVCRMCIAYCTRSPKQYMGPRVFNL